MKVVVRKFDALRRTNVWRQCLQLSVCTLYMTLMPAVSVCFQLFTVTDALRLGQPILSSLIDVECVHCVPDLNITRIC